MNTEKLKIQREKAGLTQEKVAEYLNTSTQYYQKYEKGIRPLPIDRLKKLCLLYHMSADYFLDLPSNLDHK